jgi:acyl dehydratase
MALRMAPSNYWDDAGLVRKLVGARQDHRSWTLVAQPRADVHSLPARPLGLRNPLNYGVERIRYLPPVPTGSRLRGRIGIAGVEDVPDGLTAHYHLVIEIEGGRARLRR